VLTDQASLFSVELQDAGGNLTLNWQGADSRTYTIYGAENLEGPWSEIGVEQGGQAGSMTCAVGNKYQQKCFFCIQVQQ